MPSATTSSSANNQQQQHKQQQGPVVQAIFDSLTRCFNPSNVDDHPLFFSTSRCHPTVRCPTKYATGHGDDDDDDDDDNVVSRYSGGNNRTENKARASYNADRYLSRKLEIFRTTDEDCLAEFGITRPVTKRPKKHHVRHTSTNTLVDSIESDEIRNLTSKARLKATARAKKQNGDDDKSNHPVFSFVRLLQDPFNCINEVQKQPLVGMCFATPVRSTGNEDMSNLSDWKLTDEEFAARLEQQAMKLRKEEEELEGEGELKLGGIPDVSESSLSEEEHTMTSASYFDAKYEHIKETRPPQPLFAKDQVALSENETDNILKIVERRGEKHSPASVIKLRLHSNLKAKIDQRRKSNKNKRNTSDSNNVVPLGKSSSVSEYTDERGSF